MRKPAPDKKHLTPEQAKALLDQIHRQGDPDGSIKSTLHKHYQKRLEPKLDEILRRYKSLRGKVSASDIFQSVINRLKQAAEFQEVESATAVLMSKGRKRILHHNRKFKTKKRNAQIEVSSDAVRDGLQAKSPTPSEIAIAKEQLEIANRLYETLSADDRQLLTLREALGQTYAEIAQTLDIETDAARKRCAAAKRRLLAKLKTGQPKK